MAVRLAGVADLRDVVALASAFWPDEPVRGLRAHMRATLAGTPHSTLPLVVLVATRAGRTIGFIEVGLRSHAEGCDGRWAAGFVEGWFVAPDQRGSSVGRTLMKAAEDWARGQGCKEMASDTWLDNRASALAHQALGFEIADRVVSFRKTLRVRARSAGTRR